MQYIDQPKSGRQAILSPELAVVSGRIKTDSVDDLRQFERAFPFDPRQVIAVAQDVLARENVTDEVSPAKAQRLLTPKEKSDIVFKELLPRVYRPRAAPGWTSDLYFNIEGAGDYTVSVNPDGIRVAEGKVGSPDANVEMDAETFSAVMRFEALDDSGIIDEVIVVDDEGRSEELSDEQLELVAGGKGESVCGAEACGADSGSNAACGAAAGGAGACSGAACAAAVGGAGACAGDACGAAACAAAVGAGGVCGGAACGAAVGAGGACGAAACAADAGTGTGCAAAACGAAACLGDFCAAAACPAAACLGAVCALDVAPGPDIGPCAINVIPFIPFI